MTELIAYTDGQGHTTIKHPITTFVHRRWAWAVIEIQRTADDPTPPYIVVELEPLPKNDRRAYGYDDNVVWMARD